MGRVALPAIPLSRIDFGAPAAERDIERGLDQYFVESEAYERVRSGAKRIVLGSRGIGKSAIFQVLAQREREAGSYVIDLSPEDYSYELLSQTMAAEASGSWAKLGAYAVAWKYLIYVLIMKEISKKRTALKKGAGNDIYKYVRDHHSRPQASKLSALVSYLKRMEGMKLGPYEASIKTRELEKLYKLEEIQELLPALREIAASRRIVVLVDELDRGWDSSEDARAFVAGLFQACIAVNGVHPNLRVYMSLRQELYDDIPELYEDAQKYRDLIETIQWTETSLLKLIGKRIRHAAVRDAEGLYSTERARDIAAEYRYQYPGLLNVFDAFRGRDRHLDRADLEFRCLELITREVPSAGTDGWLDGCTPESLIDILWQTGFLRAEATLAGGGRRTASDAFHGPHQIRHLNVAAVRRFQIHPMFWSYLGTATR